MNNKLKSSFVSVLAILFVTGFFFNSKFGNANASEEHDAINDPIIVTATRTAQIADQTIAPVVVITQEEIQSSQARDLSELLRFYSGMEIGKVGGTGQQASLFMRGSESDQVIMMIDGVKINASTIQQPAIQNIGTHQIEQIEIVKGPRSALYGSEGIGGVINIITKRGKQKREAGIIVGVGSDNTNDTAVEFHALQGTLRSGINLSRLTTDGFATRTDADKPHAHRNDNLNAYLGYQQGLLDIELSHWQSIGNTEYRGPDSVTFIDRELDQDFKNSATALTAQVSQNETYHYTVRLSNAVDELNQSQSDDFAKTDRNGLDFQVDAQWNPKQQTSIGLNILHDDIDVISYSTPDAGKNKSNAVFIQHNGKINNHHFVIAGRYSEYDVNNTVRDVEDETFTYNVDYAYGIGNTRWIASLGTGYRIPSLLDLATTPEKLVPEESTNYELGVKHKHSTNSTTEITFYKNEIDNLLVWNPLTFQMDLVSKSRIRGFEALNTTKSGNWRTRTGISIKDPKNLETGSQLSRRAKLTAKIGIDHYTHLTSWHVDAIASGKRYDGTKKLAGYGIINISNVTNISKHTSIRTKIDNLLNKQYELVTGYNTQDRFLMFEIQHIFK